ncbi:hypothetical protein GCM10020370_40500 [Paenibacillus hodogayensis]
MGPVQSQTLNGTLGNRLNAADQGNYARWIWAVYVFGLWQATYMQGVAAPGLGLERRFKSTGS